MLHLSVPRHFRRSDTTHLPNQELAQILWSGLLNTVNSLVFQGAPIIITIVVGGEGERCCTSSHAASLLRCGARQPGSTATAS